MRFYMLIPNRECLFLQDSLPNATKQKSTQCSTIASATLGRAQYSAIYEYTLGRFLLFIGHGLQIYSTATVA